MKIIIALDHHLEYITLRNNFSRIGDIGTTNMVAGKGSCKKQEVGKILASLPNYILSIGTIGFFLLAYLCDKSFIMSIVIFAEAIFRT